MGQTATLPCTGVTNAFREWQRLGDDGTETQLITLYKSGSTTDLQEKSGLDTFNLRGRFTATADDAFTATITNTRESDDGMYQCDSSSGGSIVHELLTYKLNLVRIQPAGPATGYVGGTFDVTCTADSKPAASFNWTKQGDSSFTATGATLRIINLGNTDGGTYLCTAYHAYASDTASVQLMINEQPATTPTSTQGQTEDGGCSGPDVVAGAAVGCFIGGLLVGGAAVFLFLRFRTAKNGDGKDTRDPADRQYENVAHSRATAQRPGSGSDEYEVPMETIQPPPQPPQSSDDYQELRPAIYQSLQKH
ncbi:endothelial cell-selective adhesion molecule-like [Branchiostoma lanceolatum]|uniref:endothelial cell-selective adhesion molecule-like n=1 Tax=Branchiostoma lanceolatum TaxID=7740 RepID=UPI003455150D